MIFLHSYNKYKFNLETDSVFWSEYKLILFVYFYIVWFFDIFCSYLITFRNILKLYVLTWLKVGRIFLKSVRTLRNRVRNFRQKLERPIYSFDFPDCYKNLFVCKYNFIVNNYILAINRFILSFKIKNNSSRDLHFLLNSYIYGSILYTRLGRVFI